MSPYRTPGSPVEKTPEQQRANRLGYMRAFSAGFLTRPQLEEFCKETLLDPRFPENADARDVFNRALDLIPFYTNPYGERPICNKDDLRQALARHELIAWTRQALDEATWLVLVAD